MANSENSPLAPAEKTGTVTPAQPTAQAAQQLNIDKPAPGGIKIVDVAPGQKINFGFAMDQAKLVVLDVDLIMVFPDGSKIVLPSFALDLVGGQPPQVTFQQKFIPVEHLVSLVGDVKVRDEFPTTTVSSTDKAGAPPTEPTPAVVQRTVVVQQDSVHKADAESFYTSDLRASSTSTGTSTPSLASAPGALAAMSNIKKAGTNNEIIATLDIELFNDVGAKILSLPDGGQRIVGPGGGGSADSDSGFSSQSLGPTLTGTAKNDVIFASDPDAGIGTATRQLDIKTVFTTESWTAQLATVKNLPKGFSILGATKVGQDYSIVMDPSDRNHLVLKLAYALPEDGAVPDERGFLKTFQLDISFVVDTGDGTLRTIRGTRTFGIRDVNDAGDATYVDKDTGEIVMVLWNNPPGTRIIAGDGNDWIEAGAGADLIEGGAGYDTLDGGAGNESLIGGDGNDVYVIDSTSDVVVETNTGSSGTDEVRITNWTGSSFNLGTLTQFANVENVTLATTSVTTLTGGGGNNVLRTLGSAAMVFDGGPGGNDTMLGGIGNDTFIGGVGNDSHVGGGGVDWVDYNGTTAGVGVTLSLASGTGSGGDASGDTYSGIANIRGTTWNDMIIGDGLANSLLGGGGNDTLEGSGGADTLDGGAGVDWLSYNSSSAGVTVDLVQSKGINGDAQGDVFSNFEGYIGSSKADTFIDTQTAVNTTFVGGDGDDTFVAGLGTDSLVGGLGSDTVDYSNFAGGTGGITVNLAAGSASSTSFFSHTLVTMENVVGSSRADNITGSTGANILDGGDGNDTIFGQGGNDTIYGGLGDDSIRASSGDLIDGGAGNDTIVGATGATMKGGDGDDRILLDATSLTFAATKIDGGNGNDTVVINQNPSSTFTGSQLAGVLSGVETIDFTQNGVNALVSLSGAQINQITGAGNNGSLSIMVNAGDNIAIADGASRYDVAVSGNTTTYTIFADDAHTQQLAKLMLVA